MVFALFRTSAAFWGALIVIPMTLYFLANNVLGFIDPYVVAISAKATESLFIIASITAACAAWDGGRIRRSTWHTLPHARNPIQLVTVVLMPVVTVALAALAIAFTYTMSRSSITAVPDVRILATSIAIVLAYVSMGFAIGIVVPPAISVPSVLIGTYLLTTVLSTRGPTWAGHLEGDLSGCCGIADSLAPRAWIAPIIFAAGLTVTAALLLRARSSTLATIVATTPVIVAIVVAGFLARNVGPFPVQPRVSEMRCAPGPPRVCVWPEHEERLSEVTALAVQASRSWRAVGISPPEEFNERHPNVLSPEAKSFGIWVGADGPTILAALAYGMLPEIPPCAYDQTQPYSGGMALEEVWAYFSATAGMSDAELERRFGYEMPGQPSVLETAQEVTARPENQQKAWLDQKTKVIGSCDAEPAVDLRR